MIARLMPRGFAMTAIAHQAIEAENLNPVDTGYAIERCSLLPWAQ